jgi:hypothetical protein
VRRITKAAIGGLAGCALILGTTQAANGEVVEFNTSGPLVDLPPAPGSTPGPSDDAFDDARATLRIKDAGEASNFKLTVTNIDSTAGPVHGAHLHVGACEGVEPTLNPGVHYQDVEGAGATPENEVWFDLVPNDHDPASATDSTTVQFVPVDNDHTPGAMSIVIHRGPAAAATPKLACFNLVVTEAPKWTTLLPEVA